MHVKLMEVDKKFCSHAESLRDASWTHKKVMEVHERSCTHMER